MSNAMRTIAVSIASSVLGLVPDYEARVAELVTEDAPKHNQKEVAEALAAAVKAKNPDAIAVQKEVAAARDALTAAQSVLRDANVKAKGIVFPDSAGESEFTDEERKTKTEEAKTMRALIIGTFKSALLADPTYESELPTLSPVAGVRGRQTGFSSGAAGTPKPRLDTVTLDGSTLKKSTIGELAKQIKATTNTEMSNADLLAAYLSAAGVDEWSKVESGTVTTFTVTVDSETGRTVEVSITA